MSNTLPFFQLKGGEIVEIGGLGTINTIASSIKESSKGNSESGFAGVFGQVLTGTKSPSESNSETLAISDLANEVKNELLTILKTDDVLEMEDGLELLNQAFLAEDQGELLALIESFLSSDTKLKDIVLRIQEKLGVSLEESADGLQADLNKVEMEELALVLEQIVSFPLKDFGQVFDGDMKDLIKALKLFELVSNEQFPNKDNGQLKDLLQQLTKKLEQLGENSHKAVLPDPGKQVSRLDFLQKTFTAVAAEINASLGKSKATSEASSEMKNGQTVNGLLQFHQTSKAEQLTLNLSQSGKPTNTADLIKQFENILARSQFSNTGGSQKLLIKLNPEHLGALRIELIQRDAGLIAKIMTTTQLAKETLDTHLNGLKQAFNSQNIQMDKIEVSQQMTQQQQQERFFGKDGEQQTGQQWHEREENNKQDEGLEEESFNFSLEEALVNSEI